MQTEDAENVRAKLRSFLCLFALSIFLKRAPCATAAFLAEVLSSSSGQGAFAARAREGARHRRDARPAASVLVSHPLRRVLDAIPQRRRVSLHSPSRNSSSCRTVPRRSARRCACRSLGGRR